jgi:hypothetical protein
MKQCIELIYDRFTIGFYPEAGVQFTTHPMVSGKILSSGEVTIFEDQLYLSVGNFPDGSAKQIHANDSADNVTTSATESKDGEFFEVNLHFEFKNPTKTEATLCEALDLAPYHVVLNQMDFTGKVASRRVIRNGVGQSRVKVSENQGLLSVDMTIRNVKGIQWIE